MEQIHARRVGAAAIACALVLRLWSWDWQKLSVLKGNWQRLLPLAITVETGHLVRFSSSFRQVVPDFVESPGPAAETGEKPCFSPEEPLALYDPAQIQPDLPQLLSQPLSWDLKGQVPRVLILHTHGTESYTKAGEDYRETAAWRTDQPQYNMLSIGQEVARLLIQAGIPAIHDRHLHDFPSYNGSYTRARATLKKQLEANPGIQLVLDLHRDAAEGPGGQMRTQAQVDGETSAQLMLVLGTNHPNYQENLSLAAKLHLQLERQAPGIMRPLQLRTSRFNQDLSPGCLLVEVGAAGNTRQEALVAARQLAQAIIALSQGTQEPASE